MVVFYHVIQRVFEIECSNYSCTFMWCYFCLGIAVNGLIYANFQRSSLLPVLEEAYGGTPSQLTKKTDFRKLVKDLSRVRRLLQQFSWEETGTQPNFPVIPAYRGWETGDTSATFCCWMFPWPLLHNEAECTAFPMTSASVLLRPALV